MFRRPRRRPFIVDIKEKRRTAIVLVIGVMGLVGAPVARYTIWRRSYEPSIASQLRLTNHMTIPAGLHLLSSN